MLRLSVRSDNAPGSRKIGKKVMNCATELLRSVGTCAIRRTGKKSLSVADLGRAQLALSEVERASQVLVAASRRNDLSFHSKLQRISRKVRDGEGAIASIRDGCATPKKIREKFPLAEHNVF